MSTPPTSPTGTQAIDRAAQLLVRVVDSAEPVTFAELAADARLPKSTVSRLLAALERHDLVSRHRDGGFRPGEVFVRYAQSGRGDRDLVTLAQPFLDRLGKLTGETVNLGVPAAGMVTQIAQVESRYLLGGTNWLGRLVPLHCSAQGKVLLAYGAADLPSGRLERCAPATTTSRAALLAELAGIRDAGYAVTEEELEPGLVAVAAPVRAVPGGPGDPDGPGSAAGSGGVVAALAVSGPSTRLTPERVTEISACCAEQAAALSAVLGYRGTPGTPEEPAVSPREEGAA